MSKTDKYDGFTHFKIKKAMPAHKMRDDIRDREARSECAMAKKFKEATT